MTPHGYKSYFFPRRGKRGGGIAFIIRSNLSRYVKLTPLNYSSFESVEMKLCVNQHSVTSICLYRIHHNKKNNVTFPGFMCDFVDMLSSYADSNSDLSFIGDFNLHFDEPDESCVKRINAVLSDFQLLQLVDKPTHNKNHILDWVVVQNERSLITFNDVHIYQGISDHFAIFGQIAISKPASAKRVVTSRNLRAIDRDQLNADFSALSSLNMNNLTVDSLINTYNDTLRFTLDQHAPLATRSVKDRPSAPWLTTEVRNARRERRRAERRWRKTKLSVHEQVYIDARNETIKHITAAKKEYYASKIDSDGFSTKQLFNVSSELLGKSKSSALPSNIPADELPDKFCQFFSNKITGLREKLDSRHCQPPCFAIYDGPVFDSFSLVCEEDIFALMKEMPNKSCILDPLPTDLVKQCAESLVPLITRIINESLLSGVVPSKLKEAVIVPLLKKHGLDCNNLKNFRPVSNLPFISKLLERVVLRQLQQHLVDNNLLEINQSAYRKGHSVETAVLSVMDSLLTNSDEKSVSLVALLDLSAAFDTLDHSILLRRLEITFGIRGNVLKWFCSYVSQRFQSVIINGSTSNPCPLLYGVPQGSVLGPVLFTLYSQSLSDVINLHNCSFHKYADDTVVFRSGPPEKFELTKIAIQKCISDILCWMDSNKLMLNTDKTEVMIVGTASRVKQVASNSITILNSDIKIQESVKYLGVRLDQTLSMSSHISDVCRSSFLSLRRIGCIRSYLSDRATSCLVNSIITSRLDFCNSSLTGITTDQLNRLQRIQNCAARLIMKKRKYDHITPVIYELHWLPLEFRIQYKLAVFAFRHFEGTLPTYLSATLCTYKPARSLRSSTERLLQSPRVNLKSAGERSFHFAAPAVWNSLPNSLRNIHSLPQFKKQLKTHLFLHAFPDSQM